MTQAKAAQELDLVPETVVHENGEGKPLVLSAEGPRVFVAAMEVLQIIDQEFLHLSIWGSADGAQWGLPHNRESDDAGLLSPSMKK